MTKIDHEYVTQNDENISIYFKLREVCKQCKRWADQCDSFLSPNIKSWENLEKWTLLVPKLQVMTIPNQTFEISLSHLRSLCIHDKQLISGVFAPNVKLWNCPLLEHLEIFSTMVTECGMKEISHKFPKLIYLHVTIELKICFKISDFPSLETLSLSVDDYDEFNTSIQICNIPNLTTLDICDGSIASLEMRMVPNVRKITTMNGYYLQSVVFHDDVPLLEDANFGLEDANFGYAIIEPNQTHVNWENMKHLTFVYSHDWKNIVSQLSLLETLGITQGTDEPNIVWTKLPNLTNVEWHWPTWNILSHMSCVNLKHFHLQWDIDNPIFDFIDLLKFPNLLSVTLVTTNGKYNNLEAILKLPKNIEFIWMMDNLTELEKSIVALRNVSLQ
jgi:hypothetical protein